MTTVEALKKLAVEIIGDSITISDITGETVPEVINYIAENYPTTETE